MEFNTLCLILSIAAVVLCAVFFAAGVLYRKKVAEKQIGSAEEEARRIINEAIKGGESKKREMLLEAKEEIHKSRSEYEQEVKERRAEVSKQERRLQQKEEALDKKINLHEKKEDELAKKIAAIDKKQEEVESLKRSQMEVLEKISGLTQEEAKAYILKGVEENVRHETAMKIKEIEAQMKEEADQTAREIIATAIQRCAADHAAETTVSVVPLPNDEMKGRIIGREGRNIRTLETITGVDLIIDDTPEAITVSSFDPVRREVARLALEKLIADGRIHPTRIEDMVEKARREVDHTIKVEGERASFETGVHNLHPEIIKLLGRQKYRTSYGQNVLNHSIEVAHIAGLLASELGVSRQIIVGDVALLRSAGMPIISTNRGYILQGARRARRTFKVHHTPEQTEAELTAIVDCGGTVEDVFVNHRTYGRMSARLDISSRMDVRRYMDDLTRSKSSVLSGVTSGYHFHHVTADTTEQLDEIERVLDEMGLLVEILPYEREEGLA